MQLSILQLQPGVPVKAYSVAFHATGAQTSSNRFAQRSLHRRSIAPSWRRNTSTLDAPTAPESEKPAPPSKSEPTKPEQPGPERLLQADLVVSSRKQWGFVSLQAVLVDEENRRSPPVTAIIRSWPFFDWETRTSCSFKVPSGFGKVTALLLNPKSWPPSLTGQSSSAIYLDRMEIGKDAQKPEAVVWCHSWVGHGQPERTFFTNTACLPQHMPPLLQPLRDTELHRLRGDKLSSDGKVWLGTEEERKPTDRIYQYQEYNDISCSDYDPAKPDAAEKVRPTLGMVGGSDFPYPRRLRTGRPDIPGSKGKETASSGDPYLPLDERFDERKSINFLKSTVTSLLPWVFEDVLLPWRRLREFTGFDDVSFIYRNTWQAMLKWLLKIPGLAFVFRVNAMPPLPLVATGRATLWDDDGEFARQLIAGMNPCCLKAETDYAAWAERSAINNSVISGSLDHTSLEAAMDDPESCVFSVDYATLLLGPISKNSTGAIITAVNTEQLVLNEDKKLEQDKRFMYAPRCLLYRGSTGRLRPVAVELCLPGKAPRVMTPADHPLLWRLAKTHFLTVDAAYHQLISHWLRTHACMEPFIIATMRNLSVLHPLWKALRPHFKYTMHINANARKGLVSGATAANSSSGIIERTFTAGKFAMPLSARVYQDWKFEEQGLPADLLARDMLIEDPTGQVRWRGKRYRIVMGDDYPYAADGMLVWDAVHEWLAAYLGEYYLSDADLAEDAELQSWWTEVREQGHPDKHEGWPALQSLGDLVDIATTLVWLASGHHAAVNFSQYSYSGYFPNYPTTSRLEIPEEGSDEWRVMNKNHDKAFLESFSDKKTALQLIGVVKLLATHDAGEEYIGTRTDEATWTSSEADQKHWQKFKDTIYNSVQKTIQSRNSEEGLKHRYLDYELLLPDLGSATDEVKYACGPPARGVPNSISI